MKPRSTAPFTRIFKKRSSSPYSQQCWLLLSLVIVSLVLSILLLLTVDITIPAHNLYHYIAKPTFAIVDVNPNHRINQNLTFDMFKGRVINHSHLSYFLKQTDPAAKVGNITDTNISFRDPLDISTDTDLKFQLVSDDIRFKPHVHVTINHNNLSETADAEKKTASSNQRNIAKIGNVSSAAGESNITSAVPSRAGNASSFSNTASSFSSTNSPLAANAGTNQTVNENSTVILVGAVSDPNPSAKLTYSWKQIAGPSVTLANNDTANPTFMSPSDLRSDTELKFLLMAKDDRGVASKPAIVTITVRHVNHPPVASAGQDQTVNSGDSVTLDGSASKDPDGDPIRYSWVQTAGPSVNLTGADRDITTFTAPSNIYSDTDLAFNLTVTDYKNTSSTTIVKVIDKYVPPLNQPW